MFVVPTIKAIHNLIFGSFLSRMLLSDKNASVCIRNERVQITKACFNAMISLPFSLLEGIVVVFATRADHGQPAVQSESSFALFAIQQVKAL